MQDIITYSRDVLNQYRLILDIPDATRRRVTDARARLDAFFRGIPLRSPASFVYLAGFFAYESEEEGVTSPLSRIALGTMPFKMHLNGYGQLNRNEIYISIADAERVRLIINRIAELQAPWSRERFNPLPRISLVRGLQVWQFERVWPYFEREPFQSRFIVNGMLLLKQVPGYRSWQIAQRFLFENQLIAE